MKTRFKREAAKLLKIDPVSQSPALLKKVRALTKLLPDGFKSFSQEITVTFNYTTEEKNVNHSVFPQLFGQVRELMGFVTFPGFKEEVGVKYLLKTRWANYIYLRDFMFGDVMRIDMIVTDVEEVSFNLVAMYTKNGELHTLGEQKIIYTNMEGKPIKMPDWFRTCLVAIQVKLD